MTRTTPRKGGSYARKDGKLERRQWTEPRKERPAAPPTPSPQGAGGQKGKGVKEGSSNA